jgi:N-acetylglucosaminyldiphosphoundecaprenol N-acetyl-beta-D-mannosaminyltransferase
MLDQPQKVAVFNSFVHLLPNYTQWLWQRLEAQQGAYVITLNAEMTMLAQKNAELAQTFQSADLIVPDGAGVVFYLRLFGYQQSRCPGIELAESILQQMGASQKSEAIYFYGGGKEIAQKAAQKWQSQFPSLNIKVYDGYISATEEEELLSNLKQDQPSIILVGLGVPRQEFWIKKYRDLCPNALWMGIGGSFDVWSGTKVRAPQWLRDNHLEWLYRLYKEPYRWYRMLALPQFFWASLVHRFFGKIGAKS